MTQSRNPAGSSNGGQFAQTTHREPDASLEDERPAVPAAEAATALNLTETTLIRFCTEDRIEGNQARDGTWTVPQAEIDRIITARNLMRAKITAHLAEAARTNGRYTLRRTNGQERGYSLWMDYTGDDPEIHGTSTLVSDDLPESAIEDFDTYVDNAEEETRIVVAEARREFGF